MHITELAEKIGVCARELDKALLAREYTDNGIVPDDISGALLALYEHYSTLLVEPRKESAIPLEFIRRPCIYFLYDGGTVTYVGKSLNLLNRLGQHTKTKEFDGICIVEVPRKDLDILELFYISRYLPRDNVDGKSPMEKIRLLIYKI